GNFSLKRNFDRLPNRERDAIDSSRAAMRPIENRPAGCNPAPLSNRLDKVNQPLQAMFNYIAGTGFGSDNTTENSPIIEADRIGRGLVCKCGAGCYPQICKLTHHDRM